MLSRTMQSRAHANIFLIPALSNESYAGRCPQKQETEYHQDANVPVYVVQHVSH